MTAGPYFQHNPYLRMFSLFGLQIYFGIMYLHNYIIEAITIVNYPLLCI